MKDLKEQHVSGYNGTTFVEVITLTTLMPVLMTAWTLFGTQDFILDFILIVVPILTSITYPEHLLKLVFRLLLIIVPWRLFRQRKMESTKGEPSLVWLRCMMHLFTAAAILAVDFHVMPRRFIKCEHEGVSLMDGGTAAFIFFSGVMAGPRFTFSGSVWTKIIKALGIALPSLVLGVGKSIIVKLLDYQEHVTEYGVHWNFFVTLSVMPLLAIAHEMLLLWMPFPLLMLLIILPYQYSLKHGLEDYILNAPRTDFFSMNREGILTLFGYYALFVFGAQIGLILLGGIQSRTQFWPKARMLFGWTVFMSLFAWTSIDLFGIPVSRRTANSSYVFFYGACCLWNLFLGFVLQHFLPEPYFGKAPSFILGIQENQLPFFLLANVATGIVNMSIDTLSVPNQQAYIIVCVYLFVLCLVAHVCHTRKLKIRLNLKL
ncbi:GPI-anchored cell wall transfer protein [Gorgonomyces haynaldii]|nr:GPI-anchored cell wall transfer protein [Gorgonomyces haynaldii]